MNTQRYNKYAIILHWVMALCFFAMLASGLSMEHLELEKSFKFNLYQWHKSLGVLLIVAFIIRIAIRLFHKPPKWPERLSSFDKKAAALGHYALYACMILIPLSGWAMVSSSSYGLPTIVFDLFQWPHIPGIQSNADVNFASKVSHKYMAYGFIALIILHIGATLKHKMFDKINLLPRMGIRKQNNEHK